MKSQKEFGSMGVSRLARVQEALAKIDGKLGRTQEALGRSQLGDYGFMFHGGGPGGWASVKAVRDGLKKERRAQLAKFGHKLNQSEIRYAKYGDADGLHAAVAARRGLNLEANLKPALRELAARSERIVGFALVRDANGQLVAGQKEFSGYDYKPAYIARRADGSIAAMGIRQAPKEGVAPFLNRNSGVLTAPVAGAGAGALAGGMLASRFMPKNKKLAIVGGLVSGAGIAAGVGRGIDKKRKANEARRVGAIAGIAGLAHNRKISEARNSQPMR